jgi:hypothetical protein
VNIQAGQLEMTIKYRTHEHIPRHCLFDRKGKVKIKMENKDINRKHRQK